MDISETVSATRADIKEELRNIKALISAEAYERLVDALEQDRRRIEVEAHQRSWSAGYKASQDEYDLTHDEIYLEGWNDGANGYYR